VPYYYWNDLYYTYSPDDSGYVVTEPPPVAGTAGADDSAGAAPAADDGGGYGGGYGDGQYAAPPPPAAAEARPGTGSPDLYVYPRNHQTDQQMATDRYECHKWAVGQTGFDPTQSAAQSSGNGGDYRRAMVACLDARGYSAR
jgi:hypothetical protein